MKKEKVLVGLLAALVWASPACAQAISPAQQKIELARQAIAKNPNYVQGHNDLALALSLRARETSDTSYYDQALEVLRKSYSISKDNFEGRKIEGWILLGKHEFAQALVLGRELNQKMPDDLMTYALLTDANVELGNYKDAEQAAQWMLDLRAGDVRGLTRGAYLRELFGNIDGAIEFFKEAYQRIPAGDVENQAWILTQMAHLVLLKGQVDNAEQLLMQALNRFPDYHYALAGLAKVRTAQGRYPEAAELLRKRFVGAPHAENLYDLAEALEKAGQPQEADALYLEFERQSRAESRIWDNSNRELVSYYIDKAGKPAEGLEIAKFERARRQDVFTLDAYAWALSANGDQRQASAEIEKALEVGVRDSKILQHAAIIAERLKESEAAGK